MVDLKVGLSLLLSLALLVSLPSTVASQQRILEEGMEGQDVRELQERLIILGERITIDGLFGVKTKRAVIRIQQEFGLQVDGIVGPKTWNRLKKEASFKHHEVESGETLSEIADLYGVAVDTLRAANNLDSDLILPGERLVVPRNSLGGGLDTNFYELASYTVQSGDTLNQLAKENNTTVYRIKVVNNLDTEQINVGQKLEIPRFRLDLAANSSYG